MQRIRRNPQFGRTLARPHRSMCWGRKMKQNTQRISTASIVRSTAENRIRASDADAQGLLRVRYSMYLSSTHIDEGAPPWEKRMAVTRARIIATLLGRESRFPKLDQTGQPSGPTEEVSSLEVPAVTMESALIMRSLGVWLNTPDVTFWSGIPTGSRPLPLPAINVHGTFVAEAKIIALRGTRLGEPVEMIDGIPVVSLDETVVDMLRYAHPLQAWVAVTSALRSMTCYHRTIPEDMRIEDHENRQRLASKLASVEDSRGIKRGRKILQLVDSKSESLPEAVLIWLLHVIVVVQPGQNPPFEAQAPVPTSQGLFHVDVGFQQQRIAIEFDGVAKFMNERSKMREHLERQHSLLGAGWDVIPLAWTDVRDPVHLASKLSQELLTKGIATRPPGGVLWEAFPSEILDQARIT